MENKPEPRRILALFQSQKWVNDYAVNLEGGERRVDVTAKVLALSLDEIHALRDDQYNTDDLVEHDHDGPFYVDAYEAICEFFGVNRLEDITAKMLDAARHEVPAVTDGIPAAVELAGDGWSIRIEGNSITSNLKQPSRGNARYNAAIDGIEALVLAQHAAGMPVQNPAYREALNVALTACAEHL